MAIYAKLPNIKGEVTLIDYPGWVELSSLQFGVTNTAAPAGGGSGTGKPSASDINLTKTLDTVIVPVLRDLLVGATLSPVLIAFTSVDADATTEYLRYTASGVVLTGYSLATGGARPTESLSLHFSKIATTVTHVDSVGNLIKQTVTWDLVAGRVT